MQIGYRSGVGELIWAMMTCRPDLSYTSVKLSQSNSCPHEIHYHGLQHTLKFLYHSKDDGLYFWRTQPCMELPEGPLPSIASNRKDLLLTVAHNSMQPRFTHTRTPTGPHASKLDGHLAVYVFNWRVVPLRTNANFNRLLRAHQRKWSLWLHTTLVK
jgi:hypothetical protein